MVYKKSIIMKLYLLFVFSVVLVSPTIGQLDSHSFDFWIGKWKIAYIDNKGDTLHGTNTILPTLDGQVIQENFVSDVGFKGTSISVYNPQTKMWNQAWADNSGGFFHFVGDMDSGNPVFKTLPIQQNDKTKVQRMIFREITEHSLTWDWQKSEDNGQNWTLMWRIWYSK